MARYLFGGSDTDIVVDQFGNRIAGRRVRFYTDATKATEVVDLTSDAAGTIPVAQVVTDANGYWPETYGPDGVTKMWGGAENPVGTAPSVVSAIYTHTSVGGVAAGVSSFNGRDGTVSLTKADVTGTGLAAADVGADPAGSAAAVTTTSIGAVPTSRTVNGHALTGNVTVTAADVGADPAGAAAAVTTSSIGAQPADADLTALAGLDSTTAGTIATDGTGWVKKTYAAFKTALGITAGDVSGLGGAALLDVGTTAGTVAAGDDARFSQSATSVADEGVALPARGTLNFVGGGVAATDDSVNDQTIVTVDEPPSLTRAKAYMGSNFTLTTPNTYYTLPIDSAEYDTDALLDAVNHQLVIPAGKDGLWTFRGVVTFPGASSSDATPRGVLLLKNGAVASYASGSGLGSFASAVPVSLDVECVAGDQITLQARQALASGSLTLLAGAGNTWFSASWKGG